MHKWHKQRVNLHFDYQSKQVFCFSFVAVLSKNRKHVLCVYIQVCNYFISICIFLCILDRNTVHVFNLLANNIHYGN